MIKIDEENQVVQYENEPDVDRNLFPNIKEDFTDDINNILKKLSRIYPATNSGYISNTGAIQNTTVDAEVYTDEFPVTPGNKITVSLKYSEDRSMWLAYCLYDASHTFISRTMLVNSVTQSYASSQFTIPDGALYCRLTYRSFNDAVLTLDTTEQRLFDVQIAGKSVVVNGVADIPESNTNVYGVIRTASDSDMKTTSQNKVIVAKNQHKSVFYGMAKASGDTTQSNSNNPIGTYTDEAKASIRKMLGLEIDFELIKEITTNSALTELEINTDNNNNSFKLKELVLIATLGTPTTSKTDTFNSSYKVRVHGSNEDSYMGNVSFQYPSASSGMKIRCQAKALSNAPFIIKASHAVNDSTNANEETRIKSEIVDYVSAIRLVRATSTSSNIPTGSNFKLYGIRYPE